MGRKRKTDNHLPQRMYMKSGSYYLVDYANKWHNLGKVYSKAMAEYGRLTDPDRPCKTISDLLDRYLQEVAPTKAETSYKNNLRESKYIRAAIGHLIIDDLSSKLVYRYMDARKKTPVAANRELALLSHMYKKAIRWGYAEINPCLKVERYPEKPRDRYIENREYLAFRDFAGSFIGAYMDFKLLTGLRKGDILKIKLNQLKEDGIHVFIHKTKKSVIIEWSALLIQAVKNIRKIKRPVTGLFLFTTRKGQPYSDSGFSSIWQRKMKAALDAGVINERFRDHDLRGKTGSDTDLQHAVELLGHADKKITERHYRRKERKVRPLG
jgi:integrase